MRGNPFDPTEQVINEAVRRSTNTGGTVRVSGAGQGGFLGMPGSFTTPATLDDGSIGDKHGFILGEDDLNDPTAYLQVPLGDA